MDELNIQWYPGHMTKTRRQMEQDLKLVDAVCEILDARIPLSSRNPDIASICGSKPRLVILNRMDMADPGATRAWGDYFRRQGLASVATDCKSRKGVAAFVPAIRELLQEKIQRNAAKGQNRPLKIMVVGIPNVGKSTFINQISGRKGAKAENRPGVTRGKQWVTVDESLLLLDTPGILWPKFEDPEVGLRLAYTGAVKDDILDIESLAMHLMEMLWARYPQALKDRYKLEELPPDTPGYALLEAAGRKRGFLLARGEIDTERMARVLLEEYRSCKLGRFTLELPEGLE
ncbi:MAG: ribosome biogenesis GTPase YlqF [Candidatus Faecousia sp.]|nr:ribosome biogenesis GTPase YlqF [Bacillota bacterium]MDY4219432.1 ribosome biogenesis GTPase YlqF [Candidatus Faecousia sp.]